MLKFDLMAKTNCVEKPRTAVVTARSEFAVTLVQLRSSKDELIIRRVKSY